MKDFKNFFDMPHNIRLYVIHTGYVHMDGNIHINKKSPVFKNKPADSRYNPSYCFLLTHPKMGHILIDTGLHPDFCLKETGNFGRLLGKIIKVKTEKGQDVISRISSLGLSVQDIGYIIMTHLHSDHASGLPLFEDCSRCAVYADGDEIRAANSPLCLLRGYVKGHFKNMNIRHFNYSSALYPFEQVSDIFGDGSVFIIRTSGHTPGHVSVLLNMKNGPLLLTGDAAHRQENIAERVPTVGDYRSGLASINKLKQFLNEYPTTRVIYSHDPDQIGSLKLSPDYYE